MVAESLARSLGLVVDFLDFGSDSLFCDQLLRGLEEVLVEHQELIGSLEKVELVFGIEASITDHFANDVRVFLLDVALVVFLVRTAPRERNTVPFAVAQEVGIQKDGIVVTVKAEDGERQMGFNFLEGLDAETFAPAHEGHTDGPTRGNLGEIQGIHVFSGIGVSTVSHQIHLQEPWPIVVPVGKGTNGYLMFEEGARLGGGMTSRPMIPLGLFQKSIDRGCADLSQELLLWLVDLNLFMSLQGLNQCW